MFKFKFQSNLPHQTQAVESTLALFEKLDAPRFTSYEGDFPQLQGADIQHLPLSWQDLNDRLKRIQSEQQLEEVLLKDDSPLRFSVEMETGTGKTYVYLKTIVDLYKRHGWKKFIILVPTNAIRAGVLQSLKHLTPHFAEEAEVYMAFQEFKGGNISSIREFCTPDDRLQVLVMSTGALNRPSTNVMYQDWHTGFQPDRPIDYLKAVRPIVIIDEPQKAQTSSNTIQQLYKEVNPLFMLDYSATHKESFPLLYRLDPFTAMDENLVKRLRVRTLDTSCLGDLQLLTIGLDNQKPSASFQFRKVTKEHVETLTANLQVGASLYEQSNKNSAYEALGRIKRISVNEGFVEFENGERLFQHNALSEPILREMMAQTIKAHFDKQKKCESLGIKVLSLFFVGTVSDYRLYKDGKAEKGDLAKWFEEEYDKLAPHYANQIYIPPAEKAHAGSFAQDAKGHFVDVEKLSGDAKKKGEASAYELIMNNKEDLLNPDTDLRFIFAHSRLREGWDCPNIFQVCTLKQDSDRITKRQEIGRGMRLAVDAKGDRLMGEDPLNSLLLVTTSSYQQYLKELKAEYEEAGYNLSSVSTNNWIPYLDFAHTHFTKDSRDLINTLTDKCLKQAKLLIPSDKKGDALKWNIEDFETQEAFKEKVIEELKPILTFEPTLAPLLNDYAEKMVKDIRGLKSPIASHANKACLIKENKGFLEKDDFKELWKRISRKAIYRFDFSQAEQESALIESMKSSRILEEALKSYTLQIRITEVSIGSQDIKTGELALPHLKESHLEAQVHLASSVPTLKENWLQELSERLKITKTFLFKVIQQLNSHYKTKHFYLYDYILRSPEEAQIKIRQCFEDALQALYMHGIQYEETSLFYKATELFKVEDTLKEPYASDLNHPDKTFCVPIHLDSNVEVEEQKGFDKDADTIIYVKLPKRFKVTIPRGTYNPDWGIVKKSQGDARVFLIRESKGRREEKVATDEQLKIKSARILFEKNRDVQLETASPSP